MVKKPELDGSLGRVTDGVSGPSGKGSRITKEAEEKLRSLQRAERAAEAAIERERQRRAAEAKAEEEAEAEIYVVQAGDTLSKIAGQLLGDPKRWKEIWAANKDLIKDPDLIQVGWKLRIPKES